MGQVVTILQDLHEAAFPDADLLAPYHINHAAARDPFTRAVAQAGTDICSLHDSQPAPAAEWLLCLLAACEEMGRRVTSANLVADRIELTVDGVQIVMGQVARLDLEALDFYRPQMTRASRKAGLLGHYLSRHAAACRLRIDQQADPEVTRDICSLFLRFHRPLAVIRNPDHLVLTSAEFAAAGPNGLCRLQRGDRIAALARRFDRPQMEQRNANPAPSPAVKTSPQGIFAQHRDRDADQVALAAVKAPLGKGRYVATSYCAAKTERSLISAFRASFRASPPSPTVQIQACGTDMAATPRTPTPANDDALVFDAIRLSQRGRALRVVAPLLMATMVLLTNLLHDGAGPDQWHTASALNASQV